MDVMKLREWLDKWSMTSLKINAKFLEMEFKPSDCDKNAALPHVKETTLRPEASLRD